MGGHNACSEDEISSICQMWLSGLDATAIARVAGRHLDTINRYLDLGFQKEHIDQPNGCGFLRRTRLLITPDYKQPTLNFGDRAASDGELYSAEYYALWGFDFHVPEVPEGRGMVLSALTRDRAWRDRGFFEWLFNFWPETPLGWRKGTTFWRDDELSGGRDGVWLKCRWPGEALWIALAERGMDASEAIPLLRGLEDSGALHIIQTGSHVQALQLCERDLSPKPIVAALPGENSPAPGTPKR